MNEWLIIQEWPEVNEKKRRWKYIFRMNDALEAAAMKAELEGKMTKAIELRRLTVPKLMMY